MTKINVDHVLSIISEVAKTKDGRNVIAQVLRIGLNMIVPSLTYSVGAIPSCSHPWDRLTWVNENEAVCMKCATQLRNQILKDIDKEVRDDEDTNDTNDTKSDPTPAKRAGSNPYFWQG